MLFRSGPGGLAHEIDRKVNHKGRKNEGDNQEYPLVPLVFCGVHQGANLGF